MDNYIVSARKYRPATFKSVIGQAALTTTLKNAIVSNKLAHAYLFCGPRGVGKTTCARIFAKTINCSNTTETHEACNECESCVAFNEQRSYNIHELDAASNNSVDDIRALIDQVRVPPQIGRYKVYIIDEVHMLSTNAFNAFLKTLEEPPAHAIFVLATTEKHKIIPTILSRCQVYDFNRIGISDIVEHLQYVANEENIAAEPEALNVIAQKADGGMRDALSIFDQTASFSGGSITYKAVIENLNVLDYEYYFKLTDAILEGNVVDCLLVLNDILNRGFDEQYIIGGLTSHFRDLLVCRDPLTAQLFQVGASIRERYIETAKRCDLRFLYSAIELGNECDLNYKQSKNKRLLLELTLIRLCQLCENPNDPKPTSKPKQDIKPIEPAKSSAQPTTAAPAPQPQPKSEAPTPQPAPAPAPKEPQPTATAAPKAKATSISGMGVSLSALNKKNAEPDAAADTAATTPAAATKNNPFNEIQLIEAWKKYTSTLKEEVLLKNTMNLCNPKMISQTEFEVEVSTPLNKQYIEDSSALILTHLRELLQNDNVSMTVRVSDNIVSKAPSTPRELFDEMVQENPALQKLTDEFGLELS